MNNLKVYVFELFLTNDKTLILVQWPGPTKLLWERIHYMRQYTSPGM